MTSKAQWCLPCLFGWSSWFRIAECALWRFMVERVMSGAVSSNICPKRRHRPVHICIHISEEQTTIWRKLLLPGKWHVRLTQTKRQGASA